MRDFRDIIKDLDAQADAMVEKDNTGQEIDHATALDLAYLWQEIQQKRQECGFDDC